MKIHRYLFLNFVIGMLIWQIGCVGLHAEEISFTNLPTVLATFQGTEYRVDPYIKIAQQLQDMGERAATQELLKLAKSVATNTNSIAAYYDEQRIAILCRMLFTNKPASSDFERPAFLGAPSFLDGDSESLRPDRFSVTKNYINWSSEPIEIVDGIPFAVVYGYTYEGTWFPHAAESYVHYCMSNCAWSSIRFSLKTAAEKKEAVRKLIASAKWRSPPADWVRQYLKDQIW
jgi:hypothetical protein